MNKILGLSVVCLLLAAGAESRGLKFPPLFEGRALENPNLRTVEARADEVLNYRLPNETKPLHYHVQITTDVHKKVRKFEGLVKIEIEVEIDTKTVTLHARNLTVDSAKIFNGDKEIPCVFEYTSNRTENPLEFLKIITTNVLEKGQKLVVEIKYHSDLRTDAGGFYLSTYKTKAGEERWLATTQFESTDARHAFPCYDEPAKRANFTFTFIHGENYNAISNTEVDSVTVANGYKTTTFKTTYKMSTYITAFIISDFEYTEGELRGLKQRVYSRPETQAHQEFALVSAMQIIASLDDYFGVNFTDFLPNAKLYQVAVPDFSAGAMENWGLTTYREEYLLYENGKSTVQTETNIANILGHEDVHQWFGDYVAIDWWGFLWLKESFAQYYSYVSNDIVYPTWDIYQLFMVSEYQRGMNADSGIVTRPMSHYVQTPAEIGRLYDSISYSKGSAVLRMWSNALTERVFRDGLTKQLKDRAFKSAVEEDLFRNIQTAAQTHNLPVPFTIDEMMGSWTRQGGHPLLTVERNYADGSFTVTQRQYFDDASVADNGKRYFIPLTYVQGSNPDFSNTTYTLISNETSFKIDAKLAKDEYLILNKQSTGFYKVQYDVENWKLISKALRNRHFKIHVLNRAELIFDANKLSSSERLEYEVLMDLLTYLESEEDYAPWATASGILTNFNFYLQADKETYTNFKFFIAKITDSIFDKLGVSDIPNERHFDRYLRSTIMNLACLAGNENCLNECTNKLTDFVEHDIPIEANLKTPVLCNGLKDADEKTFKDVHKYVLASSDLAERRSMISSLGCAQRKENVEFYVNTILDDTLGYENNEETGILSSTYSRGEVGQLVSIDFLDKNFGAYHKKEMFGGKTALENDLESLPYYIVSKEVKQKYDDLLKKIRADSSITLKTDLEANANSMVEANLQWNAKNSPKVSKWLFNFARGGAGQMVASAITVVSAFFVAKYLM